MVGPVCVQNEVADVSMGPKATRHEANLEKLTLVLDMDECLLHSKFHGLGSTAGTFRQDEARPEDVNDVNSFWLALEDGYAQVNMRPGLTTFLETLAQTCDLVVFTAAMPDYAGPVLDRIDPTGRLFSRRLYRSSCRPVRGVFLKDLAALGPVFEKSPGRCVLLDNNPCSFLCQPTNGILVTSFYDDAEDTALASVLQLVQHLQTVPDVRPVLRDMFRLESLLREYKAMLFPDGLDADDQQLQQEWDPLVVDSANSILEVSEADVQAEVAASADVEFDDGSSTDEDFVEM